MNDINDKIIVAGFGTCGKSKWREPFECEFNDTNVAFYNPVVEDWNVLVHPKLEVEMLKIADIILFPVTGETYGFGSLGEIGLAITQVLKSYNNNRYIVIFIEDIPIDHSTTHLNDNNQWTASLNARKLVKSHLAELSIANLYIVDSIAEMFTVTQKLVQIAKQHQDITL